METINKNHKAIHKNWRMSETCFFKVESTRVMYISAAACVKFGLAPGKYVAFQDEGDNWFLYETGADGFKLIKKPMKQSVAINCKSLVKLFLDRTLTSIGTKFPIEPTRAMLNGKTVLQIMLNKPI